MIDKKLKPINKKAYYKELVELIDATTIGDRVAVTTMAFHPEEPEVANIINSMCAAARRGVKAHLMVDAYIFLVYRNVIPGPLLFTRKLMPRFMLKPFRERYEALKKIDASGCTHTLTNQPLRSLVTPFSGRSHIKFAVINEEIFVGGCNLSKVSDIDMMIRQTNPETADWLYNFAITSQKYQNVRSQLKDTDVEMAVNKKTRLLLDSGVSGQSIIFENALRIINEAKSQIVMTCQYFPNDTTIEALNQAVKRGIDVKLYYNNPSKHPFPMNLLHNSVKLIEKRRNSPQLFKHELSKDTPYIHAKLLASENECLVGSNNYVQAGIDFGTAEIAFHSTDPAFISDAIDCIENQI